MSKPVITKLENTKSQMESLEKTSSIREKEILVSRFSCIYAKLAYKNVKPEDRKYADELKSDFLELAASKGINYHQQTRL